MKTLRPKSLNYAPKRGDEHPQPCNMKVPPSPAANQTCLLFPLSHLLKNDETNLSFVIAPNKLGSSSTEKTFPLPLLRSTRRRMKETNSKSVISLFSEMLFDNCQTIICFEIWPGNNTSPMISANLASPSSFIDHRTLPQSADKF